MKEKYRCQCSECATRYIQNPQVFKQGIHAGIFSVVKLALVLATRIVLVIAVAVTILAVVAK